MRRKAGALLPIESGILAAGVELARRGVGEFHGFQLAKEIQSHQAARRLTGHGTLYKALDRLEQGGLLTSRWEDPLVAAAAARPRRRLYRVTAAGQRALAAAEAAAPAVARSSAGWQTAPALP